MSWKATLDGNQVKQLKAALVCFSKIGELTAFLQAELICIRQANEFESS